MASPSFPNIFAEIENTQSPLIGGAGAYGWGSEQTNKNGGIDQAQLGGQNQKRPSTYARSPSQPLANNRLEMPDDVFPVRGLFCVSPSQYMKKTTGQMVTNGVQIIKLACEDKVSADGRHLEVTLKRPQYPFKITLDEAEELAVKLPYLLRAIRTCSDGPGSNAATLCTIAYNAHQSDVRFANQSPASPSTSFGSIGSFSSGPSSPKRVYQPLR